MLILMYLLFVESGGDPNVMLACDTPRYRALQSLGKETPSKAETHPESSASA